MPSVYLAGCITNANYADMQTACLGELGFVRQCVLKAADPYGPGSHLMAEGLISPEAQEGAINSGLLMTGYSTTPGGNVWGPGGVVDSAGLKDKLWPDE